MKPLKISCENFQLQSFLGEIERFLVKHHLPLDVVTEVDAFGYVHEIEGLQTMQDWGEVLIKTEKLLFFPFSLANSAKGVACINGEIYPSDATIPVSEQDFLGYLLKVKEGNVEIYTSIFHGGCYMPPVPSTAEIIYHAAALEEPMKQWIYQFIQEK